MRTVFTVTGIGVIGKDQQMQKLMPYLDISSNNSICKRDQWFIASREYQQLTWIDKCAAAHRERAAEKVSSLPCLARSAPVQTFQLVMIHVALIDEVTVTSQNKLDLI